MKKFKYRYIHMDPFEDKYVQNQTLDDEAEESKKMQIEKLSMRNFNKTFQNQLKKNNT